MQDRYQRSKELFQRAQKSIVGGANSPIRSFKSVGGNPVFIQRGEGPFIFDVDNNKYIDYVNSYGPLILGHSNAKVIATIEEALKDGLSFGASTIKEIEFAELIKNIMPSIQAIRLVSSGTEATLTAIRMARGYTQRNKIIKFQGCYHGHNDSLLVKAGSTVSDLSLPDSVGIPVDFTKHTLTCDFNDQNRVEELFNQYGNDIAGIIVEPIAGNMNMILPEAGFLAKLRNLCNLYNSVLIFDEVMTGFRVAYGGAQELYNIKPDLTCLGKIVGGGMPIGAVGGQIDLMNTLAPVGPVFQAGTLSGNPIAVSAGLATLKMLSPSLYPEFDKLSTTLVNGLKEAATKHGIPISTVAQGAMFGFVFTTDNSIVENYHDVAKSNLKLFTTFFKKMLSKGIYLAPSGYEANFLSTKHSAELISKTINAADTTFKDLQLTLSKEIC